MSHEGQVNENATTGNPSITLPDGGEWRIEQLQQIIYIEITKRRQNSLILNSSW